MEERTLEGQALDLGWVRDGRWDLSVDDYLCMASHKPYRALQRGRIRGM